MSYKSLRQETALFAGRIKGLGFRVFLADEGAGYYGFITDEAGSRVLSFSFTDGSKLSGNYGPPSTESGTGWCMERTPYDLRNASDVKEALYATAPAWTGRTATQGWRYYTTLEQHLQQYGKSSKYSEITS